jgi:hypothetical protein
MKPRKLTITEKIGEIDFWSHLSGSFDQVIESLKVCKDAYHSEHSLQEGEEIFLHYNSTWDEGSLDVILTRYENDKEYDKRIKKIQKEKIVKEQLKNSAKDKELKEYERLKRKYEKKS